MKPEWTGGTAAEFLIHHQEQIDRMCKSFGGRKGISEMDDFRQDVATKILMKYDTLRLHDAKNPRAVISTWIGWQIRAVLKKAYNAVIRNRTRYVDEGDELLAMMPDDRPSPLHTAHVRHAVDTALSMATPKQRMAVMTALSGYNDSELREHFGCSLNARNGRLATLANRMRRGTNERSAA